MDNKTKVAIITVISTVLLVVSYLAGALKFSFVFLISTVILGLYSCYQWEYHTAFKRGFAAATGNKEKLDQIKYKDGTDIFDK